MHGAAPGLRVLRSRLRPVDSQLGALELIALLDDRARLVELAAQLVGARIRNYRSGLSTATEKAKQREDTENPRPRTAHGAMLHCRRFLPRHRVVSSRTAPADEADSDHRKGGLG